VVNRFSASRFREFAHTAAVVALVWFKNVGLVGEIDRSRIVSSAIISQEGLIDCGLFTRERG
jgi:hypothetical protein